MSDSTDLFRNFTARLLEHEGALVEPIEPGGLEVLVPEPLQNALITSELLRLGFASEVPVDSQRVSLESDWLERFSHLLGERGRNASFALNVSLPAISNAERIAENNIAFQNAVYRLVRVSQAWARYHLLLFRYTAISDEKREGTIAIGFNTINGSAIDAFVNELFRVVISNEYDLMTRLPVEAETVPDWPHGRIQTFAKKALPERVRMHIKPFLKGLQRRLDRDLARVYDYHNNLRQESLQRLNKQTNEQARECLRLEATAREYQAKIIDLKQKYELRVDVELDQSLALVMPVNRFELLIKRRKGERRIALDWNPLVRKLDALPCEWSFTTEALRMVCDDALHIIAPGAHAPCVQCEKPYCRACHTQRCPKCKHET